MKLSLETLKDLDTLRHELKADYEGLALPGRWEHESYGLCSKLEAFMAGYFEMTSESIG